MEDTLKRLAEHRESILAELERNTQMMKEACHYANERGYNAPTIAKMLGVTKRTVYLWLQ